MERGSFIPEQEKQEEKVTQQTLSGEFIKDVTDKALFVRTSADEIEAWDRQKIALALVRETDIESGLALEISAEVEKQVMTFALDTVTASLIRELVNAELLKRGLNDIQRKHIRLGVPIYDATKIIIAESNKDNANVPHGPEATNLTLAETIKKEFALSSVFSKDVADAHIRGDIHLHDLGMIDRPYCSGQSPEYIKKFGLDLSSSLAQAKPAKHAVVFLAQLIKFSAALQCHFSGAIGWDAINLFIAPFLVGMSDEEVKQLAQMLIFEFSQQSVARGGQAIFSDINIYWEVPKHFEDVMAIGPGGEYTGKVYAEYEKDAQRFAWALFEIYKQGDAAGRPFFFPKPLVHITEKFFQTEGHEQFLYHLCDVSSKMGSPYFVFDRHGEAKISECCRLSFKLEKSDIEDAKHPERMRYSAMQNITINLPRVAYKAAGDEAALFAELDNTMETMAKAHREKRVFIEHLLSLGDRGPLAMLAVNRDGKSIYYRLHRVTHLIGMVGLNEVVQAHTGSQLHESKEAVRFGLKVIAHMNLKCTEMSEKYGLHFVLEQTPAETTAFRFAKLDLRLYPEQAKRVLKGNLEKEEIYYTNSTQLAIGKEMDPIQRVVDEGIFHPLIDAGAITHIWLGESKPSVEALATFVKRAFTDSKAAQIAFSPEFTTCCDCEHTTRGLQKECVKCGSTNVDGITRVTGYFSRTSMWNKGKLGELTDRFRNVPYFDTTETNIIQEA